VQQLIVDHRTVETVMADSSQSLLGVLKTGDLVLVAPPALARWLPGRLGRRRWHHVALVVRDAEHQEPMVWEAAPAGVAGPAVRLRRLVKRLQQHPGRIGVRRLNRALEPEQCARLAAWRAGLAAEHSERSLLDLMGAGEDGWLGGEQASLNAPLPAELVAQAYQRLGLLDGPERRGRPAQQYAARDFGEQADLRLNRGFALGPEIVLTGEPRSDGWQKLTAQPAA
jgi:hypothetical protein